MAIEDSRHQNQPTEVPTVVDVYNINECETNSQTSQTHKGGHKYSRRTINY